MSDLGLVSEVTSEVRGSFLAADLTIGDTEVVVEYGGDFDNEGGTFDLNGTRLTYSAVTDGNLPDDPDTLTLTDVSPIGADEGDTISVVTGGQIAVDYWAVVQMDNAPAVMVPLKYDQLAGWPVGIYDPAVPVLVSEDLQHLEDAPGRTPIGRSLAWNRDYADAASDGATVTIPLTWLPAPDSMQVKQRGVELDLSEWAYDADTNTVTVAPSADVIIHAGDRFRTYYDRDGAADAISSSTAPMPTVIGATVATGLISSIALPTGTEEGHQLVLIHCGWTAGSCSDSRMTTDASAQVAGAAIPLGFIALGEADASGSPVTISTASDGFGNHHDITILVAVDASSIGTGAYANDPAPATATGNLPSVTASFALAVGLLRLGGGTTGAITPGSGYALITAGNEDAKVCAVVSAYTGTDTPAATPTDTYGFSGSVDGWALAVYPMEG